MSDTASEGNIPTETEVENSAPDTSRIKPWSRRKDQAGNALVSYVTSAALIASAIGVGIASRAPAPAESNLNDTPSHGFTASAAEMLNTSDVLTGREVTVRGPSTINIADWNITGGNEGDVAIIGNLSDGTDPSAGSIPVVVLSRDEQTADYDLLREKTGPSGDRTIVYDEVKGTIGSIRDLNKKGTTLGNSFRSSVDGEERQKVVELVSRIRVTNPDQPILIVRSGTRAKS